MHVSALEEYGLRCAIRLATAELGATLPASQVAEREGLSVQYVGKIMHLFRKAGIVQAERGTQGGFRLAQSAEKIPLKSILAALKADRGSKTYCEQHSGQQSECVRLHNCSVRPVWQILSGYFDSVLEKVSLADLARTEDQARKRVEVFARAEAQRIQLRLTRA